MKQRRLFSAAWMGLLLAASVCRAGAPVGWRGDGTGRYPEATPPVAWARDTNVVWKTKLPDWSNASPIIVRDRLFVCAEPATLICLSLTDGRILWQATNTYFDILPPAESEKAREEAKQGGQVREKLRGLDGKLRELTEKLKKSPDDEALKAQVDPLKKELEAAKTELKPLETYLTPPTHGVNGYSSCTPTSDGRFVYVLYGNGVAACYDLKGNRRWARVVEKPTQDWGHSSSPLLVGDTLLVQIRQLTALDAKTGATRWQFATDQHWGSPVHARVGDSDVVMTAGGDAARVSDGTGVVRRVSGLSYCAPIVQDGVAYFIETGGKAVRLPEAVGSTNAPAVLWETKPDNDRYYASPVYLDGLIYAVNQKQVFSAIDAATGSIVYSNRLALGGTAYPSVTLAGKLLYVSSDNGATAVIEPGREFKEVARNRLDEFRSTPVFLGKRMYVRTMKELVCIGQ